MRTSKGFTLLELMIICAIIGILAAVSVPSFISYKERAEKTQRRGGRRKKSRGVKKRVPKIVKEEESSVAKYQRETERLRRLNQLPKQLEHAAVAGMDYDERDCIGKLKRLGYKITREETVSVTEKQKVVKEY